MSSETGEKSDKDPNYKLSGTWELIWIATLIMAGVFAWLHEPTLLAFVVAVWLVEQACGFARYRLKSGLWLDRDMTNVSRQWECASYLGYAAGVATCWLRLWPAVVLFAVFSLVIAPGIADVTSNSTEVAEKVRQIRDSWRRMRRM